MRFIACYGYFFSQLNIKVMFLDDKLIKICEEFEIETTDDIQELNQKLTNECVNYYTEKLNPILTNKEVKVILDKTFNLFDSFVRMLEKSTNPKLNVLHKLFKDYTFKKQFLANAKVSEVYAKL